VRPVVCIEAAVRHLSSPAGTLKRAPLVILSHSRRARFAIACALILLSRNRPVRLVLCDAVFLAYVSHHDASRSAHMLVTGVAHLFLPRRLPAPGKPGRSSRVVGSGLRPVSRLAWGAARCRALVWPIFDEMFLAAGAARRRVMFCPAATRRAALGASLNGGAPTPAALFTP